MKVEDAKKLRDAFAPEQIGKLPKPTKKENAKGNCDVCGGYHGLPAIHLDYVGHAAVTDRLLQVDPTWTWEPMVVGPNGEPLIVNGGLWIKLTVAGVTRPGWGDGANVKEMIGDAIRNAAMRFGVALDLWAKEDISHEPVQSGGEPQPDPAQNGQRQDGKITAAQVKRFWVIARENNVSEDRVRELLKMVADVDSSKDIPRAKYEEVVAALTEEDIPF